MNHIDEKLTETLFKQSFSAFNNAYAPYSKFKVGASILTENHEIYGGCNVENVSYPCSQCAESSAIGNMIAKGGNQLIKAIMVMADYNDKDNMCIPCGACRQKINEFSTDKTILLLANTVKLQKTMVFKELLPYSFNKNNLTF